MHLRPRTHGESFVGRGGAPGSRRLTQSLFETPTPEPDAATDARRPETAPATLDGTSGARPTSALRTCPNPVRSGRTFVQRLCNSFGAGFVAMLASSYFGVKGFLYNGVYLAMLPFYRNLGTPPARYQALMSVAGIPWSMKAAVGVVSDTVPFLGYHKRYYIVLASCVSLAAFTVLATVPMDAPALGGKGGNVGATLSGVLFFCAMLQPMVVDLLCEGKYAELLRQHPETGASIVSWVWFNYNLGSLVSSSIVGPLTDLVDPSARLVLALCVPFSAQVLVPTLRGMLPERQLPVGARGVQWAKLRDPQQRGPFLLAGTMAVAALVLAVVDLVASPAVILAYSVTASVALCIASFRLLPPQLARCNLYMYLVFVLYIQVPSAISYWYTAPPSCVPGGPHFDDTFFLTYSSLVGSIFSLVGIWLFQTTMSTWRFRPVFWINALLRVGAAAFDLVIVKRWNQDIGISDHVMYMCGDNIIYQVVYILDFMPAWILTSKLCPKGMEATVYALLAGFQNFGQSVSQSIGIFMIELFDIRGTDTECNYKNLPLLIIVCHLLLPLLTVPLTFWLIPDRRLTDDLDTEGEMAGDAAVSGDTENGASGRRPASDGGGTGSTSNDLHRGAKSSRDDSLSAGMLTPAERRQSAEL